MRVQVIAEICADPHAVNGSSSKTKKHIPNGVSSVQILNEIHKEKNGHLVGIKRTHTDVIREVHDKLQKLNPEESTKSVFKLPQPTDTKIKNSKPVLKTFSSSSSLEAPTK